MFLILMPCVRVLGPCAVLQEIGAHHANGPVPLPLILMPCVRVLGPCAVLHEIEARHASWRRSTRAPCKNVSWSR